MHDEKEKEKEQAMLAQDPASRKQVEDRPSVGTLAGLNVLFHNSDALLFFFLVFVVGVSSGIIENFAYVRIREVGGTGKDMGLSRLVSSVAGAPMFWFSGPLTELFGADKIIVLSLCSYVLRFVIYALMQSPLQGLPAEAMRGVTFAAFWSTCTIYASRIAPPGMGATMVRIQSTMKQR
jgi:MFS family permease